MVFSLKILWRWWWIGKCFFINFKNILSILVLTFWLNGRLNQIMFRLLFLLVFTSVWAYDIYVLYPLSCNNFLYKSFALSNSSLLQANSDNLLFIIFGRSFMIVEGTLLGFLNGKNLLVARLNVTSRKSVSVKLVSIVIVRSSSLKRAMMLFLILSNMGPLVLFIAVSQSSLFNPTLSFPSNLDNFF